MRYVHSRLSKAIGARCQENIPTCSCISPFDLDNVFSAHLTPKSFLPFSIFDKIINITKKKITNCNESRIYAHSINSSGSS